MPDPNTNAASEVTTWAQSWLKHQQAAEQAAKGQKIGSIVVDAIALRALWHLRDLAPFNEAICAQLSAERKKAYKEALVAMPGQLEALQFAHREYSTARLVIPGVESETLQVLDKRGAELEELGMRWLEGLSLLGKVRRQTLETIKAGKGYLDRASDLNQIANLLTEHIKIIERQTAEAEPGAEIITRADIKEMDEVSVKMLGILQRQSGPAQVQAVDWKAQRMGCFLLCDASWESIRTAARFYFDTIGDKDSYKSLLQLKGMRQFKLRP
jgi:hypothetical protein